MMVLCPLCHDAATKGALTEEEQRHYQAHPHNVERGYVSGAIKINQGYCALACGGVLMAGNAPLITVDGDPLLSLHLEDGVNVGISCNLFNAGGDAVAVIDQNEWISGDASLWDMESDHQKLTIWGASRKISLRINAKMEPARLRGEFYHQGHRVSITNDVIKINHKIIGDVRIGQLALVGLSLNIDTEQNSVRVTPYIEGAASISEPNPAMRLHKAIEYWREIVGRRDNQE